MTGATIALHGVSLFLVIVGVFIFGLWIGLNADRWWRR